MDNLQYILSKHSGNLTREQERILFVQLVTAKKVKEKLEKKQKRTTVDSSQLGIARGQIRFLREALVTANIALVTSVAQKITKNKVSLSMDELISTGFVKLLHCIDGFDPSRGFRFSTYAQSPLFKEMCRTLSQEMKHYKIPLPEDVLYTKQNWTGETISLRDELQNNSSKLNKIEAFVIRSLYCADEPKTMTELGLILKLTKSRIGQIRVAALEKLKKVLVE